MTDKLPQNFDHEKAGTKQRESHGECSNCHENPCKCDARADAL